MKLEILTSGIWQTNSTVLAAGDTCVLVDPAYFPRELAELTARAAAHGGAAAIVFTHGHWDHVMGHSAWPSAPVWLHQDLRDEIAAGSARAARYLEDARAFDSRWYVPRPHGYRWPSELRGLADGEPVALGRCELRALHLPGHSPDGLGLWVEAAGALLCGDYLSPCEIPFLDDGPRYAATLRRLIELLEQTGARVIPGHGPALTCAEALDLARADLPYVERMTEACAAGDRARAEATPWPRAQQVVGMREAHEENLRKLCGEPDRSLGALTPG